MQPHNHRDIIDSEQHSKPREARSLVPFVMPDEFAHRVGRTVMLHVQRQNWSMCRRVIDAAQQELEGLIDEAERLAKLTPEERAAETHIAAIELDGRYTTILEGAGFTFVSDIVVASDAQLLDLESFGEQALKEVRQKVSQFLHAGAQQ